MLEVFPRGEAGGLVVTELTQSRTEAQQQRSRADRAEAELVTNPDNSALRQPVA